MKVEMNGACGVARALVVVHGDVCWVVRSRFSYLKTKKRHLQISGGQAWRNSAKHKKRKVRRKQLGVIDSTAAAPATFPKPAAVVTIS